ncbi:hypothetical protein [Clostridium chauvoei]|uniref:Uncharacterized protein n=2 Tax=Clostridium chauvoei TaxID=46867 RepID=S6EMV8_9CLOT|nr:hypothetical protein [Clostridium chauvoei]ATD54131.1 hypothetical protein BTM20_02340 [Clostridium chauvoei]ATD58422.1 hypothetical protein BTM21_12140 [Clostridium chauvoei]MBX7281670.1 hypothetical protein [Clostridium chauvoei]MBX7284191.1 hypothetical protein [Clostridium chauvoei]MBX7286719.1 hypothetical protein [Clostridium chauvoei]
MSSIMFILIIVASVFVSFKMAEEKGQAKYVWSIVTGMVGPFVIIIQYLSHYFKNRYATR